VTNPPHPLARWEKAKLALFAVRHTLGLAIFAWLVRVGYRADAGRPGLWMLVVALAVAYGVFAVIAWKRLYRLYRTRPRGHPPGQG